MIVFCAFEQMQTVIDYGKKYGFEKSYPLFFTKNYSAQVLKANIREWRHFLKLRCSPAAHPQMREVALILLDKVHALIPVCFDDIWSEYHADV